MRRVSRSLLATCILTTFWSAAAQCEPASFWNHNGSVMAMYVAGDEREMRYHEPRIGMRQEGVVPGSVRFKGTLSGNAYVGTAFVFSRRCGTHPYRVTGALSADEREITLHGTAPAGFDAACRLIASRKDVVHFSFLRAADPPQPAADTIVSDRRAAEAEAAAEQARLEVAKAEREEQRLRELHELQARKLREQQEQAERVRRERAQEERRLAEVRGFELQREGCQRYNLAACDIALTSPHASAQDVADLSNWRGVAEKLRDDVESCRTGSVAACNAALASAAVTAEQRTLLDAWRIAASPVDRAIAFISMHAATVANVATGGVRVIGGIPELARITGGIAIVFGLTLAAMTLRRSDPPARGRLRGPRPATARMAISAIGRTRRAVGWMKRRPVRLAKRLAALGGRARPPARDTAGAIATLGVAHACIEEVREAEMPTAENHAARTQQLNLLAYACEQLDAARKLDPDAVVEGQDREGAGYRFGIDQLRAEACLLEGITVHPHDAARAIGALRKATALNSGNAYAFYVLGVMHATVMSKGKAVAALKRAVALQPQNLAYRKELDRALHLSVGRIAAYKAAHVIPSMRAASARIGGVIPGMRAIPRASRRLYLAGYRGISRLWAPRAATAGASAGPAARRARPSRHLAQVEGQGEIGVHAARLGFRFGPRLGRRAAR